MKSIVCVFCTSLWIAAIIQLHCGGNVRDVEAFVAVAPYSKSLQHNNKNKGTQRNTLLRSTATIGNKNRNTNSRLFSAGGTTSTENNSENDNSKDGITLLHETNINRSSTRTNATLIFPPFGNLMDVRPGEYIASEAFTCRAPIESNNRDSMQQHRFRVKLYPRGGGGDGNGSKPRSQSQELVGLYLEYLGPDEDNNNNESSKNKEESVRATFSLRLKGQQQQRRFDVEWMAGMCFVADPKNTNLNQGFASEFGAPLMQTGLLQEFLGIVKKDQIYNNNALVEAEVLIHSTALEEALLEESAVDKNMNIEVQEEELSSSSPPVSSAGGLLSWNTDIRLREDGKTYAHDTKSVRVGKIVVPVLSRLSQRPKMFEQGAYPGVEYRILRILDRDGQERFTSCPGADYELKPVYPLVAQLERQWPVRVNEQDIPKLYTPSMYNLLSAFGSLFTAATGLFMAFLLSQAISLFFIPSKSMDPTLKVGDVLLVDKVSSRTPFRKNKVGDMVLFSPPSKLQEIVAKNGGNLKSRDLFVKRIAASPGDKVTVYKDGKVEVNDQDVVAGRRDLCEAEPLRLIEKYIEPSKDQIINPKEVFVMGDCSSVSVDSRVWGPLDADNIVGRPIVRLWPFDRFGKVE
mmetsp:Transcript_26911/g.59085  ORF Transcript_26911/g.59085 Transcript_26911/m.59085 type:complete len:631 (-) Transcript_26911:1436-3328(-)|eukprot:CAMPEP_0168290884 /NCGR_PEP_ID=MMETSP0142_2-20121227/5780_1 /TAXON_ID=44445 /ORGANISM="Pseudo-nitzschia australis, Strain 10249 10 AB" /LENGTH=630 /DNA_ID=CAMNT_0008238183 /DNA_START=258 /DNA_END=2150 /DNA_ORIENTATION=-